MLMLSACSHPGPVLDFGSRPPLVGGTLAGIVSTTSSISVQNRRVTVTDVQTAATYESVTDVDGGYTVQVPRGTYHIELALNARARSASGVPQTRISAKAISIRIVISLSQRCNERSTHESRADDRRLRKRTGLLAPGGA